MDATLFRILSYGGVLPIINVDPSGEELFLDRMLAPAPLMGDRRLFTATLLLDRGSHIVRMFHACHASSEAKVYAGLSQRTPSAYLALVTIRPGINQSDPIVRDLVPSQMLKTLVAIGDCCPHRCQLGRGGVIHIEEGMG